MRRYIILVETDLLKLQSKVDERINDGWQLQGAMVTYRDSLTRYFIREMMLPEGMITYEAPYDQEYQGAV